MVEIWMEKAILVTFQMKMKNMLLETGGKVILVVGDKELGCTVFLFLCQVKLASDEIG